MGNDMKSEKIFALCLAVSLAFGYGMQASAQPGGGSSGGGNDDPLAIYRAAGINSDQEQEIRRLAKEFEDAQRVRLKSLLGLMQDMNNLQRQADPPEPEVLAKQEEINKLTNEMATERVKLLLKVRKVLTADQKQKLVKILTEAANRASQGAQQGE